MKIVAEKLKCSVRRILLTFNQKGKTMELTSKNVSEVVQRCLYTVDEIVDDTPVVPSVIAKGVVNCFGFHPNRIETEKENIVSMLNELPESFKEGDSFLNACNRKDGTQWGEHRDMELLFCLGVACKAAEQMFVGMPHQMLPGGMPYYRIN